MQYRFVLIGCGKIAHRHIAEVNRTGICVGVTDPDPLILAGFSRTYQVPGYNSPEELLSTVSAEIAVICSPNYLHISHITQALQHGLHVLCEKPLCIRPLEAEAINRLQDTTGRKVYMVFSARFHAQVIRLHHLVQNGHLGRILSFNLNACWNRPPRYFQESNWKGKANRDGGILFTQFSHYIDALLWCIGECRVSAVKRSNALHPISIEGEDTGVAILSTATGTIGSMHWSVNSIVKNMEVSLLVIGETGTIKIGGEYMHTLDYEVLTDPLAEQFPIIGSDTGGSHHDLVYDELVLALSNQAHQLPGIDAGLASVKLIAEIYDFPQDPILQVTHA